MYYMQDNVYLTNIFISNFNYDNYSFNYTTFLGDLDISY